jgi:hypothetical protein
MLGYKLFSKHSTVALRERCAHCSNGSAAIHGDGIEFYVAGYVH